MKLDLYIDLDRRKLVAGTDNPGAPTLPNFTQGDTYDVWLHFLASQGGISSRDYIEERPSFSSLKLGIGQIDQAPKSGTFQVKCGADSTPDLAFNISKAAFAAALNALGTVVALGGVTVESGGAANIFRVRWCDPDVSSDAAVLTVEENRLAPKCFSRVQRYETDQGWLHMIKVMQAPIAFTDQFLFPTPPEITCAIARSGTGTRNAVASLSVPDGALGSFDFTWGGIATEIVTVDLVSSSVVEDALNALYTDGVQRFAVTNPRRGIYYIEYVGPLGLSTQDAPTVNMHDQESRLSPLGHLSLDTSGVELALDGATSVKGLTLECEITSDGESSTLFQQSVTLYNDMIDAAMSLVHDPTWLVEVQASAAHVDYDPAQSVIGMLGYQNFAGDAVADAWTYTHDLSTLNVHITVREVATGLRIPDNLYVAEILNQNQVRITFPTPPAANQYVVIISSANASAHFLPHSHQISDVVGLQAALDALSAAGNPLELWPVIPLDKLPSIPCSTKLLGPLPDALIPDNIPRLDADSYLQLSQVPPEVPRLLTDGSLAVRNRTGDAWTTLVGADGLINTEAMGDLSRVPGFSDAVKTILAGGGANDLALAFALPSFYELYPGRATAPTSDVIDAATLPKPGGLLPAIHDATVTGLTVPIPAAGSPYTGNVYLNNTGSDISLSGGMGRKGSTLKAGGHVACDGRLWYRVEQQGSTTSYHPTDFDRELLMLDVNESMFPVGSVFTLLLDFEAQILRSETRAQWVVIVETGAFTAVGSGAGTNISGITWEATPALAFPIHLTPILTPHNFGVQFTRAADVTMESVTSPVITGKTKLYRGAWTTTTTGIPASPGFALRARLARFDTEDSLADPRGYILLAFNPNKKSLATIV